MLAGKHPFKRKNRADMYNAIFNKPAKMLESFSLNATLLLMGLLTIDPQC
jgi:hypothetical protein